MEMNDLTVGRYLKELRSERSLTLEEASALTGVSKPMLGQIERGHSSPTINTLWKIATGFKVPLSFFCRQKQTEYQIAVPDRSSPITEENGHMRAYSLFPFDPIRNMEIFFIEFDNYIQHKSNPHAEGVEEYLFIVHGSLTLQIAAQAINLTAGQTLRFQADTIHSYVTAAEPCQVYNMIFYANERHI